VGFHDRAADRESHAHAALLGGEEGSEHALRFLGRDPDAAIRDGEEHLARAVLARPDLQLAAPVRGLLHGDFGISIRTQRPVIDDVLRFFPATIELAVAALLLAVILGIPLGVLAGYFGGAGDEVIMRVTDIFLAFPPLLLALAFATVLPANLTSLTIAIAISWWPWYTRLVRGQAASVAGRPYVEACRALGIPSWRILLRHVLPNSITPVIVQVSLDVGGVILTASALSFLGLGAQDPTPDWGLMVAEGQNYFTTQWWLVTFPGLAILVTALAFTLLGDGLRDVLDPRRVFVR